jgi:predicted nucleic acid-binding protein
MYLLDTNVVSEMRKVASGKANQAFVRWFSRVDASQFYVSVITLMELELGVSLKERSDAVQGALLRVWLEQRVLPEFAQRTISVDADVALRCTKLHVPDPRNERDALIAASALIHKMAVVTRNVADFEGLGLEVVNPWVG